MATVKRELPPHPDRFFVFNTDSGQFQEVEGHPIKPRGMSRYDIFIHDGIPPIYAPCVSEGKTGGRLLTQRNGETKSEMLQRLENLFASMPERAKPPLPEQIDYWVAKNGISPRWKP